MKFEWSAEKRAAVFRERGVDLLFAALIFEGVTLSAIDDRTDYGEIRTRSLGLVDDIPYFVVHTTRGDNTRLITAWKGGQKDYDRYQNFISG